MNKKELKKMVTSTRIYHLPTYNKLTIDLSKNETNSKWISKTKYMLNLVFGKTIASLGLVKT